MRQLVDLTGKKILVTGASSGIGRATSIVLSQLGAQVILIGRNEIELKNTLGQMTDDIHRYYTYDLTDLDSISILMKRIVEDDGKKLDGMVHCAGISLRLPVRNLSYDNMDVVMKTNFYSFVELVKQYSHRNSNGGSIVAISSVAAEDGGVGQTIYAASKAALDSAVKTLSKELARKGIRVNSVRPSYINTAMLEELKRKTGNESIGHNQLLGIGEPEDVANLVAFLLSDASKFITGSNYLIDGGSY
ncbi:MAG: SDR family NAD(P)-dependent oxidoreductase [Butyrivibrio sp.]